MIKKPNQAPKPNVKTASAHDEVQKRLVKKQLEKKS